MAKRVWLSAGSFARDVVMPAGNVVVVAPGGALDTSAEHAATLLEQVDVWSASAPEKATAAEKRPRRRRAPKAKPATAVTDAPETPAEDAAV